MNPPNDCPDPSRLRALLGGDLDEAGESSVVDHLDRCPDCRALLDRWAATADPLAGLTARATPVPSPALERVLERLKAVHPGAEGQGPTTFTGPTTEADEDALPGRIGPYELVARVGRGGMGVVFKAIDPALNRVVAVKVLAPELAASPLARRRFLREARAAAAVCHDHVVTIHAVDEVEGLPYLVMQFVAGRSLQEKIDQEGRLGLREMLRIGTQVASGLAAAHAQGLVHRDIKPANILLENGIERAKITDFGLAVAASDARLTRDGAIAGTPQYMAPEVARGEPVDARTDLFSLGSVLYAMATGEAPFGGESAVAVLRRVSDAPPRPIRELNPELPAWLVAVIGRLMAKDPAARYQTAVEVAEVLARRLAEVQGREPPVMEPSQPRRGTRFATTRWRWAVALTALAFTALIALAVRNGGVIRVSRKSVGLTQATARETSPTTPVIRSDREWLRLGLESMRRGEPALAVKQFSEALRDDPENVTALNERGKAFSTLADLPRASADLSKAIRLDPRNSVAYGERSYVRLRSNDFLGVIADCDEAIKIDPSNAFVYNNRGKAYNSLARWDLAIADLNEMIHRVPTEPWAYFHRAYAYRHRDEPDRALADCDRALALNPEVPHFHIQKAGILADRKDFEHAVQAADEAIRLAPDEPMFRIDRAQILVLKGDGAGALADYDKVIASGRFDAGMYDARAEVRASVGDAAGAKADRAAAARLRSGSPRGGP